MRRTVRSISFVAAVLAIAIAWSLASASPGPTARTDNVAASLIAEVEHVRPGDRAWVALRFDIRDGWHTYWRNPGDSGEATTIDWILPEGVTASEIHWPYPERLPIGPLANYGYKGTVLHLVEIGVPEDWPAGEPVPLAADVHWLVCDDVCIPEDASLALDLPTGPGSTAYAADKNALFGEARSRLPSESPWPARFVRAGGELVLTLETGADAERTRTAEFFPFEWGVTEPAAEQRLTRYPGGLALTLDDGGAEGPIGGVVVLAESGGDGELVRAVEIEAEVGSRPDWLAAASIAGPAVTSGGGGTAATGSGIGLFQALLFALLGGIILNLMPCVFPVLSIKALSLVGHAHERRAARLGGLAYTAGILAFMGAVAGVLIGLRAAGAEIGWGFQLQEPAFVAVMALIMFALGLWLSGVLTLGARLAGAGQGLAERRGLAGSFFTGALAALVATPCTAPFMGAAIGFAVVQPWPVALGIMLALGLGLALPYLALSFAPGLARLLPRPGPWMERLKQVLAFPLYATAAWLVWVLAHQAGAEGVALALGGMVLIGFGAWLKGATETATRSGWRIGGGAAAGIAAVAALALAVMMPVAPGEPGARVDATTQQVGAGPRAETYSAERLEALRAEGKPVFINLTAAWCITCHANERVALSSARIADAFAERDLVYLKGDWTNRDPEITRLLAAHGRNGVPLYLVYPPGGGDAVVLPQLLTEAIVLNAIATLPVVADRPPRPDQQRRS